MSFLATADAFFPVFQNHPSSCCVSYIKDFVEDFYSLLAWKELNFVNPLTEIPHFLMHIRSLGKKVAATLDESLRTLSLSGL